MLGSRFIRLVAVVFVSGAALSLLWPQATGYVSTFAVVNAPVLTIRAPINGSVKWASLELANPVRRGEKLFVVHANRASRAELTRLTSRMAAFGSQIQALIEEEQAMASMATQLETRILASKSTSQAFLKATINQAKANLRIHEIDRLRATATLSRVAQLAQSGSISDSVLVDARHDLDTAMATITADQEFILTLQIESDAIDLNISSPQGIQRGENLRERLDDIFLRRANLISRRKTAEGEFEATLELHAALAREMDIQNDFRPTSSVDGVIWSASLLSGSDVNAGDEIVQILDCQRRFIEVNFSERAFESLSPGTVANVRLKGSNTSIQTTVIARHAVTDGTGSALDGVASRRAGQEGVTVFLELSAADINDPQVASAFCDVGRTAEVHIPRGNLGAIGTWVQAVAGFWIPSPIETVEDVVVAMTPSERETLSGADLDPAMN